MPTYRELERSLFKGRPIEVYHFFRGTEDWFYTSSKFTVIFESETYTPLEITRGQIDYGGEDRPGALPITFPTDTDLGLLLQAGSVASPVSVRVTRIQSDAATDPAIIFLGELGGADVDGENVTVQCWPFTARMDLTVPQGLFQRDQCQWNTYDPNTCKVDKATYTFEGEVTEIDGLNVTVDGALDFDPGTGTRSDMFSLGIIQKGEQQGMIDLQMGNIVRLIELLPTLVVGDMVQLVAGDDRSMATCRDKFANAPRRLAFAHMPVLNPFYGQGLRA